MPPDDDPRSALEKLIDSDPYGEIERPPCERCGGSGEVFWNDHPRQDPTFEQSANCPACDGQG